MHQTFHEKLAVKAAVRKRDRYKCVDCGMPQKLISPYAMSKKHDVHRIYPDGPYSLENCKTLCRSCHCRYRRDSHFYPDVRPVIRRSDAHWRKRWQRMKVIYEFSQSPAGREINRKVMRQMHERINAHIRDTIITNGHAAKSGKKVAV